MKSKLTFENLYPDESARGIFSKVSSIVISHSKLKSMLTFENMYPGESVDGIFSKVSYRVARTYRMPYFD